MSSLPRPSSTSSAYFLLCALLLVALAQLAQGDLLCLTNLERQKQGLQPLSRSAELELAAQRHSQDMYSSGSISHDGTDGSSPWDRFRAAGLSDFSSGGENVAAGQTSEEEVMSDWMNSPGHRANILGDFTHFGGARVGNFWTQDFATTNLVRTNALCPDSSSSPPSTPSQETTTTTTDAPSPTQQPQQYQQYNYYQPQQSTNNQQSNSYTQDSSNEAKAASNEWTWKWGSRSVKCRKMCSRWRCWIQCRF